MDYQYSFDEEWAGNRRWQRKDYELIHHALGELRREIAKWNELTIQEGGQRRPYEQEEKDVLNMVTWGDKQLKENNTAGIEIPGISVGSLRYTKAALLLVIYLKEQDLEDKRQRGWPSGALQSVEGSIRELRKLAAKVTQPPADVLWELIPCEATGVSSQGMKWDVFISHAFEDKDTFVRPLAAALRKERFEVWFDEFTLTVGDSLRRSIDRGLAHSRYGVVVISPDFLNKEWTQKELDGLVTREMDGHKVILPIWHNIDAKTIRQYSPLLADRVATSSTKGVDAVVADLARAMGRL